MTIRIEILSQGSGGAGFFRRKLLAMTSFLRGMAYVFCSVLILSNLGHAETGVTKRIPQLSNEKVNVWKTVIYPTSKSQLTMHRHDYNRVVVALTDGRLKIRDNRGNVHYLTLEKGNSYYLTKDPLHELHTDENISHHPIRVIVIELKF